MIGLIGMSHLGINTGIAYAARGFDVLGFDPEPGLTSGLNDFKYPIFEKGLEELHRENKENIRFTSRPEDLSACDLVYFAFDVPTNSENKSDLGKVSAMISEYSNYLKEGTVFVVLSQVPPGFCRSLLPSLAKRKIELYYQVETLVFGIAVDRAVNPERYIVGCVDPKKPLAPALDRLLRAFACPILPMKLESAELAKISINLYLTSTVTVTNVLAEICENIGAEWSEIVPALKLDKRIGPHAYLAPGLGLAGGNLERDLVTIQGVSREHGTESSVVDSWFVNSVYRRDWMLRTLQDRVLTSKPNAKIGILGLAYKVGTHSLKNAPSVLLLSALRTLNIRAYDPEAKLPQNLSSEFCRQVDSPLEAAERADALLVFTPYPEFKSIGASELKKSMAGRDILDPFNSLNRSEMLAAGLRHHTLGK